MNINNVDAQSLLFISGSNDSESTLKVLPKDVIYEILKVKESVTNQASVPTYEAVLMDAPHTAINLIMRGLSEALFAIYR